MKSLNVGYTSFPDRGAPKALRHGSAKARLYTIWMCIALRITVRTFLNSQTLSLLTVPCSLFPVPLRVAL
jgi:hypothetical protein